MLAVVIVAAVVVLVLSVLAVVKPHRVKLTAGLGKLGLTLEAEGNRRPSHVEPPDK